MIKSLLDIDMDVFAEGKEDIELLEPDSSFFESTFTPFK